ncbi:MAG: O-antigen ligase family protein [Flavisolibacter sp.]
MTANGNKMFIGFISILLLFFTAWAAYWQQLNYIFIPVAIVFIVFLLQYPKYLFYILIASVPWSVEYNFSATLATDFPDEPLMLLTALAAIILLIQKRKTWRQKSLHPLLFLILLQLAWTVVAIISSTNIFISLKYLLAKTWYLLAFVVMPIYLLKNQREIKRLATILSVSMLSCMCIVLIRHGQHNLTFENVNEALHPFFRNHVNYSALLVCMVPLLIAFIKSSLSKNARFFLVSILLITIAALYFSYARGAWLALFTGVISYWLLQKRALLFSFVLFLLACTATVFWLKDNGRYLNFSPDYKSTIFHTNFEEHLVATYQMKDLSTAERYYRWIAGVRMIKDSWKTGFGPNTFYDNYKSYTVPAFKTWVSKNEEHSTVHNYFLLLFIEQGFIGLLLFLLLSGSLFWYAQKIYHRTQERFWKTTIAAVSAILVMICTVNFLSDLIETDKTGSVFYLCVAVLIIADVNTRNTMDR